jgi:hypothetical protein
MTDKNEDKVWQKVSTYRGGYDTRSTKAKETSDDENSELQ